MSHWIKHRSKEGMNHKVRVRFSTCKQLPVQFALIVDYIAWQKAWEVYCHCFSTVMGPTKMQCNKNKLFLCIENRHAWCMQEQTIFFSNFKHLYWQTSMHSDPAGRPFHATTGSVRRSVTHGIIRGRPTCALGLFVDWLGFHLPSVGWMLQSLIDITCLVYRGVEWGWQDRKAEGEGLTVNARRIIKTCEWRWIITSQAHLDMHTGGNALGGKKCPCELQASAASEVFRGFLESASTLTTNWRAINLYACILVFFAWCAISSKIYTFFFSKLFPLFLFNGLPLG